MLFFGPDDETPAERGIRERKAKAVCAVCPLQVACLDYALQHPVRFGIWGGLTCDELSSERRRLRRTGAA